MTKTRRIDRAKRMAAGHACMALFGVCNTVSHSVQMIALDNPPSGIGFGAGLGDKEKEFVAKLATDIHENGETLRKLGWRFRGVKE